MMHSEFVLVTTELEFSLMEMSFNLPELHTEKTSTKYSLNLM
ncbi:MAG TPA: hypothetical protein PKL31_15550 [Fulvivirga sp.]|nr:hypothetical protein [Fulvivirga sp.]